MRVVVFGAAGRTGRLILADLRSRGLHPVAAARRGVPAEGAEAAALDLDRPGDLRALVSGADGAISALASSRGNPACSRLADALAGARGLRFVSVSGSAVDMPGDAKPPLDRAASWAMQRLAGPMVADRQREAAILARSALHWTLLRPPRLLSTPATGRLLWSDRRPPGTTIPRADLARAAVDALLDAAWIGRAPFVAAPRRG